MKKEIAFISGHRDITEDEFAEIYVPIIEMAISNDAAFVVGDYYGVDIMAQEYLKARNQTDVTVYHMFESPRNYLEGFKTIGGFTCDEDRDAAMTLASDYDIAYVRANKKKSGTARNLTRRNELLREKNKGILKGL